MIKYPRTPHLKGSRLQPGDTSDGQVSVETLTEGKLVWEEKIDGANCGISFSDDYELLLQSRGHYLNGGYREKQFSILKSWAASHEDRLFDLLGTSFILYGEWCYAKHTVFYDQLPHYFHEFDMFDKDTGKFLCTETRHAMLKDSPVVSVPVVHVGMVKDRDVKKLVKPSLYKSQNWRESLLATAKQVGISEERALTETEDSDLSEGLYLKQELDGEVIGRFKYVRADFLQSILESGTHWADRDILPNQLAANARLYDEKDLNS